MLILTLVKSDNIAMYFNKKHVAKMTTIWSPQNKILGIY